ncbi:SMI1/KNR4 family protein [Hymenobacter lapidiphilus]|uniref:SMI1/KNR4 family protein n=1 Tax=Hymenobacter sp. CCM 8763 TaxID=2303334 RepID=UPI000E352BEA|nr:SMI1/KNR4 family protein [Hymenobacter sp. CCM 8763]RFP66539.1 SMI1/KNR4 family protein [Hymenobacter sp. CCM 8763]
MISHLETDHYAAQIARIKAKLPAARAADTDLKVFGADSHHYQLQEPVAEAALQQVEADYGIRLPEAYRCFMREVGNGGAGPFYGIYPLGHGLNGLVDDPAQYLRQPCRLQPGMTDAQWKELTRAIEEEQDMADEAFERAMGELYAGLLPLGDQGCANYHALVLNGPFAGRVVNVSWERYLPGFAYEANFLDWYERWLDEVIADEQAGWFGYNRGGPEAALLHLFQTTTEASVRAECVVGLKGKKQLSPPVLQALAAYEPGDDARLRLLLAQLLLRFDYAQGRPRLLALVPDNLLGVLQSVVWYAKSHSADWLPVIAANLDRIQDTQTLDFATYVLQETGTDYGPLLLPFAASPDQQQRITALHALAKLPNKAQYLTTFITGLHDAVPRVVHTALQAVSDLPDPQLRPHYQAVAIRFAVLDDNYIMVNIDHALKTQGISLERLLRHDYGSNG